MDSEHEYKIVFPYIEKAARLAHEEIEPTLTWKKWVNLQFISIDTGKINIFGAEAAFLIGAFSFNTEIANELIIMFYKEEYEKLNKFKEWMKKQNY